MDSPLEALSVLLPERLGVELPEVLADPDAGPDIERAFLMGLPWRDPTTIGPRCGELIVDLLAAAERSDTVDAFDALVTCAIVPGHPLGATFLDEHLRQLSMPDRDAAWSRFLYLAYGTGGPVDRLLDWAEKHPGRTAALDRETATACATVLAWMLTASQRFVRDRATKGLVALLTDDILLMCELVRRFDDVDDFYVRERVMAAAYGVAMRNTDPQALAPLADLVYRLVFAHGEPPAHVLLRDYARGIIERALQLGVDLGVDARLVEPPYHSTWPHIPDDDEMQRLDPPIQDHQSELSNAESAQRSIAFSVMHWDFARYVIGTNSTAESSHWLSIRHADPPWQSAEELAGSFRSSLDEDVQHAFDELWTRTRTVQRVILFGEPGIDPESHTAGDSEFTFPIEEPYIDLQLEEAFVERLSEQQNAAYEDVKAARGAQEPRLALDIIQRYVLWRAFDLGWTIERFGDLDWRISRSGSSGDRLGCCKPERIGKKYQWIAYHEILALISDHYRYRAPYSDAEPQNEYRGTWQLAVRDIDPSAILTGAPPAHGQAEDSVRWWRHDAPIASVDDVSHEQWLQHTSDIPDREQQLRFTDPEEGSTWIKLQGSDTWQSRIAPGYDRHEVDHRDLWLNACGYLIDATDVDEFIAWSETVHFWGRWMPEPPGDYSLYFGELGWSFAFEALLTGQLEPQHPKPQEGTRCPIPLRPAALHYLAESGGYDASLIDSYRLYRPNPRLVNTMNLHWTGHGADFVDADDTLIAFDPSARDTCSAALLVREESLARFLDATGSAIVWAILGEKRAISPRGTRDPWASFLQLTDASVYEPGHLRTNVRAHIEIVDRDR